MDNYEEILLMVKDFIKNTKREPQYYDQRELKEIEDFIQDPIPQSARYILQKSVCLELDAMVKKCIIEKISENGGEYYQKVMR